MKRTHLSSAIGLVLGLAFVAPLQAQQVSADDDATKQGATEQAQARKSEARGLEAVKVTARRRDEWLQDVPVAISAFSDQQLSDLQADDISGIQHAVPNLYLDQGDGANAVVYMRGVG